MEFATTIEIRYAETDAMGIVYHGNYLPWFELGRTHLLRELGIEYAAMEEQGFLSPVLDVEIHYGTPCKYGETAIVYTTVEKTSAVRTVYAYRVFGEQDDPNTDKPRVTGKSTHCLCTATDFKPVSVKKHFPDLYAKYLEIIADNEAEQDQ